MLYRIASYWNYYVGYHLAYHPWIYGVLLSFSAGLLVMSTWYAYKRVPTVLFVLIVGWLIGSSAFSYDRSLYYNDWYLVYAGVFELLGILCYHPVKGLEPAKGRWPLYVAGAIIFLVFILPFLPYFMGQVESDPQANNAVQILIWAAVIGGFIFLFRKGTKGGGHGH